MKMTKSKQYERECAIRRIAGNYGLPWKKGKVISFWQLAKELNDSYYAKIFLKKHPFFDTEPDKNFFIIPSFQLDRFLRMIRWTVNRMKDSKVLEKKPEWYYIGGGDK